METRPNVYASLSGPEKAALVRAWKRFAGLVTATANGIALYVPPTGAFDGSLSRLDASATVAVSLAKAREQYLWRIRETWFRATFKSGEPGPEPVLPEEMFEQGQTLDDVLWEYHPVNLFDAITEASTL